MYAGDGRVVVEVVLFIYEPEQPLHFVVYCLSDFLGQFLESRWSGGSGKVIRLLVEYGMRKGWFGSVLVLQLG